MEAILKDVVAVALRHCREHGVKVGLVELAYRACLHEAQGSWHPAENVDPAAAQLSLASYSHSTRSSDTGIASMAEQLAQEVIIQEDPSAAATIRLQIAMWQSRKQQRDRVEAEQTQRAAEISRLATAVAQRRVNTETAGLKEYQTVFEAVVDYVCAATELSAKTSADAAARAEVSAAVESVFPLSGIAYFITLPAHERTKQMEFIAHVACGICLFNTVNTSSPAAATLLPPSAAVQLPHAHRLLETVQQALAEAEMAFEYHNNPSAMRRGRSSLSAAVYCCQAVVSLRNLCTDIAAGMRCCVELDEGITAALEEASKFVSGSITGVPKDLVLPVFERAGRLHLALAGELRLLVVRARLWEDMCAALESTASASTGSIAVPRILGFSKVHGIGSSSTSGSGTVQAPQQCGVSTAPHIGNLPAGMQYISLQAAVDDVDGNGDQHGSVGLNGMCPVSLAESVAADGGAAGCDGGGGVEKMYVGRMADPTLGYVRYHGVLLGFSSFDAMQAFIMSPTTVLDAVKAAVHTTPLLAHTLGLTAAAQSHKSSSSQLRRLLGDQQSVAVLPLHEIMQMMEVPMKVDSETQTPTHFAERHVDVNYEWNEWALRRRIIALANLRNKATHSTQTALSHFRRDGDSQTWQQKAVAVQTQVHKSSSMPRNLRYVTGLRGAPPPAGKKTQVTVVSLELDIGQTHQY